MISVISSFHPIRLNEYTKRYRFDYSDVLDRTDIDAIRIASQFVTQPSFSIEKLEFIGTPREHFKINHIIAHLPVINIDIDYAKTKKIELKINCYNQLFDVMVVSTKDIKFFIDNKETENIYCKTMNHYSILRLRKNEGLNLSAKLEWDIDDSISSSKISLLVPTICFDDKKKTMDIIIESKGFWTSNHIIKLAIQYIFERLEHYADILEYVVKKYFDKSNINLDADNTKQELNSKFTVNLKDTIIEENVFSLIIDTPNSIDFDLCTKNVLANVFNSNKDSIFIFDYFTNTIKFTFISNDVFETNLMILRKKINQWKKLKDTVDHLKTFEIKSKEDDLLYFKYFNIL